MVTFYQSTRDKSNKKTASQAILQGLAEDGGLFVPVDFPKVDLDFEKLKNASYQEIAELVLKAFFDDFLKIPCRTMNFSIYSSSGSHLKIRFSQFMLPSTAKLTELSCPDSSQLYSTVFSSSFVSHLQSVYHPFHVLTD